MTKQQIAYWCLRCKKTWLEIYWNSFGWACCPECFSHDPHLVTKIGKNKMSDAVPTKEFRVFRDGDQWCATEKNFINLTESPAAFDDTPDSALAALLIGLHKKEPVTIDELSERLDKLIETVSSQSLKIRDLEAQQRQYGD